MLEDLQRSEANRKAHVCPEQPLAHLFSKKNDKPVEFEIVEPKPWQLIAENIGYEVRARSTDKRDLISEMGYAPAVG